jgi:hypothetical protein
MHAAASRNSNASILALVQVPLSLLSVYLLSWYKSTDSDEVNPAQICGSINVADAAGEYSV